jgi:4'-phosphopantetheinyl transferase
MPGWLSLSSADVPAGDGWLSVAERRVQAGLVVDRRRADWRVGRWTAKSAVGAWLGVDPADVEIFAASDGAPEAWLDGRRASVSVSISHRAGRGLAAVAAAPAAVGCDLELIEPRSGAFVREWLSPADQGLLASCPIKERPRLVNLVWTAKEAVAKMRRAGLRLDVRAAVVAPAGTEGPAGEWRALRVDWEGASTAGWWRCEPGWVMSIVGRPAPELPQDCELERLR